MSCCWFQSIHVSVSLLPPTQPLIPSVVWPSCLNHISKNKPSPIIFHVFCLQVWEKLLYRIPIKSCELVVPPAIAVWLWGAHFNLILYRGNQFTSLLPVLLSVIQSDRLFIRTCLCVCVLYSMHWPTWYLSHALQGANCSCRYQLLNNHE